MKKGFTLIELLAVILILAIIALIAIPVVNTILNDSKKASSKESANNYVKAVEQTMALKLLKSEVVAGNYTVDALASNIEIKGTKPSKGTLVIDTNGNVTSATLCINSTKINYSDDKASIATTGSCADIADPVPACAYTSGKTWTFDYTGAVQNFTVPCTGNYKLEVWGAQGGLSYINGVIGGKGGYSVGTISLSSNANLFVLVGGAGLRGSSQSGGFNGGGNSHNNNSTWNGGSGGGASDIRVGTNSLYARVIVAGGGGGAGDWKTAYTGGVGGGTTGGAGVNDGALKATTAGTQISGGVYGYYASDVNIHYATEDGAFGQGGYLLTSIIGNYESAGGGGGWYGGGAGTYVSGGGGSGWIYTASTFATWQTGNTADAANWLLNSSYYLSSASTVDGSSSMPTHDSTSTMTGNSGNGYVKITYVGQ